MLITALLSTAVATTPATANVTRCAIDTGCIATNAVTITSNYDQTKYPLVLAHGMSATNTNYAWYGIPEDLTSNGARVYVTKVTAFSSSEIRGEQLLKQVQEITAISNSPKVNLLGHSHGGQSIRYVAGVAPALVASLTSVGSPHKGSAVADLITQASKISPAVLVSLDAGIVNLIGDFINITSNGTAQNGYTQDSLAAMSSLTASGAADFNNRYPMGIPADACGQGAAQAKGIPMFSWSGTGLMTNPADPTDYWMSLNSLIFMGQENDGLVGKCSSHFGTVIRDNYFLNHLDEVNLVNGLVSPLATDPKSIYRQHLNRLKNIGL